MRQVTRKGLLTVAAASGVLAMATGTAHADADANGAAQNSPGVGSGNNVQVPVNVPVNVCGNTINVVGLLNPTFGNTCVNDGDAGGEGGPGHDGGGAQANGSAQDSPGVGSGNNVQVPVEVPVNACGNSVDVVGVLNPSMGNECANGQGQHHERPPGEEEPEQPPTEPEPEQPPAEEEPEQPPADERPEGPREPSEEEPEANAVEPQGELAETGSNSTLLVGLPVGAGLVLGGVVLYRRRTRLASRV